MRCWTFGSEVLQYEVGSKVRMYFGGDIPDAQVVALIFGKNCQF